MADQRSLSQRTGVTPAKLTLIGILGVVLVAVLYVQYGRSSSEAAAIVREGKAARTPRTAKAAAPSPLKSSPEKRPSDLTHATDDGRWSAPGVVPDLESVIQHDPFALPDTFPQPKTTVAGANLSEDGSAAERDQNQVKEQLASALEQIHVDLEQLRRQGVQIILAEGDEFVAMVGEQTIHVGDVINGFKVVAIDYSGVHVERVVQE